MSPVDESHHILAVLLVPVLGLPMAERPVMKTNMTLLRTLGVVVAIAESSYWPRLARLMNMPDR